MNTELIKILVSCADDYWGELACEAADALEASVTTKYHDDIVHGWHQEVVDRDAKIAKLEAGNSEMRHVLGMVACEFEKGSWQRRDIDAAIKEDT